MITGRQKRLENIVSVPRTQRWREKVSQSQRAQSHLLDFFSSANSKAWGQFSLQGADLYLKFKETKKRFSQKTEICIICGLVLFIFYPVFPFPFLLSVLVFRSKTFNKHSLEI